MSGIDILFVKTLISRTLFWLIIYFELFKSYLIILLCTCVRILFCVTANLAEESTSTTNGSGTTNTAEQSGTSSTAANSLAPNPQATNTSPNPPTTDVSPQTQGQ